MTKKDALKIIDIFLEDLIQKLMEIGVNISISKRAKKNMVLHGFSQEFGARNLYRQVQTSLENPISEMILDNEVLLGDTIKVDEIKGKLRIISKLKEPSQSNSK